MRPHLKQWQDSRCWCYSSCPCFLRQGHKAVGLSDIPRGNTFVTKANHAPFLIQLRWTILSQVVTSCTTSFNKNNTTFFSFNVFMCFDHFTVQKWLVFVMKTACVHCPVRIWSLNIIQVNLVSSRATPQACNHLPLTADARVQSPASPCKIENVNGKRFLSPITSLSPSRHRFFLVSLCLKANAEMVPKIPSCHYMLLM